MNWCKLGFHKIETVTGACVQERVLNRLKEMGYDTEPCREWFNPWSGSRQSVKVIHPSSRAYITWGDIRDDYMPMKLQDYVCLRCGHIKSSYNIDKIIRKVQRRLDKEHKEKERQDTAKAILRLAGKQ